MLVNRDIIHVDGEGKVETNFCILKNVVLNCSNHREYSELYSPLTI